MTALVWLGRHASALLLLGFFGMPFLPVAPEVLRPLLPVFVILVTALGTLRQSLRPADLARFFTPRGVGMSLLFLAAGQLGLALILRALGSPLGLPMALLLPLVTFCAAPPLSSAPNLAALLGYDFSRTLRLTLLGTLIAPLTMPLSLMLSGVSFDASIAVIALRILAMLAAGVGLGILLQLWLGGARIAASADLLNAVAALAMLGFLVPLLGGASRLVQADPKGAATALGLAVALNLGGNLAMRRLTSRFRPQATARALGLVFGNRNTSLVLAALPFDPRLALFVAAMQAPIYIGPFLFSRFERRQAKCPVSSVS